MHTSIWSWQQAALALTVTVMVSCATPPQKKPKQSETGDTDGQAVILARMGNVKLTSTYFRNLLADMNPSEKDQIVQNPQYAEKLVRDEILKYYLLDLSNQTGWSLRPEVIRKAQNSANQSIVSSFLKSKATVNQSYPDEALIQKTYAANRDSLRQSNQVRLAQIFIGGQSDAEKNLIKTIYQQLAEQPERFSVLARRYSKHEPSAGNGGDLGWNAENSLLPGLSEVVARMKAGDISPPIQTKQGYHIIRLLDRKQGEILTLEQARPLIVNQLRVEKARRNQNQYLQNLLKKNPISMDNDQLKSVLQSN